MEENSQNLPAPVSEGKGSAIAGLVLGICSIACDFVPFLGLIPKSAIMLILILPFAGLIMAIVGAALARDAGKRGYQGGIRTAGRVLSIIGLIFSAVLAAFICGAAIFAARSLLNVASYISSLFLGS